MMNPEDVCGDDPHTSSLHFQDFFFPVRFGVTRKVELAHHRQPRLGIFDDVAAVHGKGVSGFGDTAQMEKAGFRGRYRSLRINRYDRVRGLLETKRQDCKCRKESQAHRREYRLLELFHSSEIE